MLHINNLDFLIIDHTTDAGVSVKIDFTQAHENKIVVQDPIGETILVSRTRQQLEKKLNEVLDSLNVYSTTEEYCPPF